VAARLIQCPLCSNPVQPRFLTKGGICPTCDDERKKWQRANFLTTSKVEQAKDVFYAQQHKKFIQVRKDQKAKIEAQAKEKALAAERKQLKEIYKEKASIALAKTSLLHYVERYSPGYDASWAHEHVANELEQFYRAVARKESPRLVLTLPSRFGKAVCNSTKVFTPKGWTNHGDLQPGDYVFGSDGKPTRVVACSDEMDINMEVEFANGEIIRAHENHEWLIYEKPSQLWRVVETKWLHTSKYKKHRVLLNFGPASKRGTTLYTVNPNPRLILPNKHLPIDPYVLGAWLGDGSSHTSAFTHHPSEMEVMLEIQNRGYEMYVFHALFFCGIV
jgi:hypothetical protein